MTISMHGDAAETAEAKRIIRAERLREEGETKCFVVMGSGAELAQVRMNKQDMVRAIFFLFLTASTCSGADVPQTHGTSH